MNAANCVFKMFLEPNIPVRLILPERSRKFTQVFRAFFVFIVCDKVAVAVWLQYSNNVPTLYLRFLFFSLPSRGFVGGRKRAEFN